LTGRYKHQLIIGNESDAMMKVIDAEIVRLYHAQGQWKAFLELFDKHVGINVTQQIDDLMWLVTAFRVIIDDDVAGMIFIELIGYLTHKIKTGTIIDQTQIAICITVIKIAMSEQSRKLVVDLSAVKIIP